MPEITEINEVAKRYANAVYAKDVEAAAGLYDENVVIFDLWERWVFEGRSAWRANLEEWFGSLGDERVRVEFEPILVQALGDAGLYSATVRYVGVNAAGEDLRSMANRLTWTLVRGESSWCILHEHTSAPASFETGKVNLSPSV